MCDRYCAVLASFLGNVQSAALQKGPGSLVGDPTLDDRESKIKTKGRGACN